MDKDPTIFDALLPSTRGCFKALVALDKKVAPLWLEYVKRAELGTVPPDEHARFCREVSSVHAVLQQALEPILKFVDSSGSVEVILLFCS